jgi:hypothetical protein
VRALFEGSLTGREGRLPPVSSAFEESADAPGTSEVLELPVDTPPAAAALASWAFAASICSWASSTVLGSATRTLEGLFEAGAASPAAPPQAASAATQVLATSSEATRIVDASKRDRAPIMGDLRAERKKEVR